MNHQGRAGVITGDAARLPLPDASVDLIVTSPPYWSLRSYESGGAPLAGQLGAEPDWRDYLADLWACTAEWLRVLKPGGSLAVNIGDKYSDRGHGPNRGSGTGRGPQGDAARQTRGAMEGSLLNLPHRYAIGCTDRLGLIQRAEIIWHKPNGMPESAKDRVARVHEHMFHFTRPGRYYSACDEIREPPSDYSRPNNADRGRRGAPTGIKARTFADTANPLGRLPGSVWRIPTIPLVCPAYYWRPPWGGLAWMRTDAEAWAWLRDTGRDRSRLPRAEDAGELRAAPAHYAAMPPALVRPVILGWSPPGICTACGQGRRSVAERASRRRHNDATHGPTGLVPDRCAPPGQSRHGKGASTLDIVPDYRITGYACACPEPDAPARPAIVLDPCGGTGTVALVAAVHGRHGITTDLSGDYSLLATWRTTDPAERARALAVPKPPPVPAAQAALFD